MRAYLGKFCFVLGFRFESISLTIIEMHATLSIQMSKQNKYKKKSNQLMTREQTQRFKCLFTYL